MKKYFVTGGYGFIGSNFIIRLFDRSILENEEFEIHCVDNLTYAANINNLPEYIRKSRVFSHLNMDIASDDIRRVIETNSYEYGVNFAAESHVDRSIDGSDAFVRTNVSGVNNLLNAWKESQNQRFLQIGTDEVYGSVEVGSTNELAILDPSSPYSATKASADLLALAFRRTYNMDVIVTRCCNNYGPRQHKEKLIPKLIDSAMQGRDLEIYGDGKNVREWIYVDDHVDALFKILDNSSPKESIYNIGSGIEFSNNEISQKIIGKFGKKKLRVQYIGDRPGHDFRYSLDSTRIGSEMKFSCEINFENGLEATLKWFSDLESFRK